MPKKKQKKKSQFTSSAQFYPLASTIYLFIGGIGFQLSAGTLLFEPCFQAFFFNLITLELRSCFFAGASLDHHPYFTYNSWDDRLIPPSPAFSLLRWAFVDFFA
jgi:hypothetical protein